MQVIDKNKGITRNGNKIENQYRPQKNIQHIKILSVTAKRLKHELITASLITSQHKSQSNRKKNNTKITKGVKIYTCEKKNGHGRQICRNTVKRTVINALFYTSFDIPSFVFRKCKLYNRREGVTVPLRRRISLVYKGFFILFTKYPQGVCWSNNRYTLYFCMRKDCP